MTDTATTARPARTSRVVPHVNVSVGAVRQSGGALPLYRCNACQAEVVWAESTRTGRRYLANVFVGAGGSRFYIAARVHECAPAVPDYEAERRRIVDAQVDLARQVVAASRAKREAKDAGDDAEVARLAARLDALYELSEEYDAAEAARLAAARQALRS